MLCINKVRYKNLLSTGNAFIEFDFTQGNRWLFVGKNGSGKSTLLDALCFALFGKTYRDINKPTFINSINNKNGVAECEFRVNDRPYKIVRGMNPAVLQVYDGDTLVKNTSSVTDFQKYVEDNILHLNYNAFRQIVVLGSSKYTTFMKLTAAERRTIIENILDLTVFSTMNVLLKSRVQTNKEVIEQVEKAIYKVTADLQSVKTQYLFFKEQSQKKSEDNQKLIDEHVANQETLNAEISEIEKQIINCESQVVNYDRVVKARATLSDAILLLEQDVRGLDKAIAFYKDHAECPTCLQAIDESFKQSLVSQNQSLLQSKTDELESKKASLKRVRDALSKMEALLNTKSRLESEKADKHRRIQFCRQQIDRFQNEKPTQVIDIEDIKERATFLKKSLGEEEAKKREALTLKDTHNYIGLLLKDSGIKAKIISKFLPIINKYINHYLDLMNFYVQFELDENFKEVIKSRHRDVFSYENFSMGQQRRIDLALLFTWREIAKLKNSMNVNLLLMDEIFDSSLDKEGTEDLIKILDTLNDTTVVIISHKMDEMNDKFDKVLRFELKNNFTTVKEVQ